VDQFNTVSGVPAPPGGAAARPAAARPSIPRATTPKPATGTAPATPPKQ
jgi:hypothetical protein